MASREIRVLFTGGGSGGHISPLLAVAEEITKLAGSSNLSLRLDYLGPIDKFSDSLAAAGIICHKTASAKLRRYASLANILDIPKFFWALIQAFWQLYFLMPDVLFSKGGTGAFPVVLAAWFYRVPIVIHESDSTPGLTNLLSSWFATRIAIGSKSVLRYFNYRRDRTMWTGTPIRPELLVDVPEPEDAREMLGFNRNEPLIMIYGGSQGAQHINDFILALLPEILKITQVLFQTGSANYAGVERLVEAIMRSTPLEAEVRHPSKVMGYLDSHDLKLALAATDLVVTRAGATSLAEIAAFGRPAIIIPLPDAVSNGHQRINAYAFAENGAAIVMEESNLLPKIFLKRISEIVTDKEKMLVMRKASAALFKPDAARLIAEEILRVV